MSNKTTTTTTTPEELNVAQNELHLAQKELTQIDNTLRNPSPGYENTNDLENFINETSNYGFTDCRGNIWKVDLTGDQMVITGEFPGLSPATKWIERVCQAMEEGDFRMGRPYSLLILSVELQYNTKHPVEEKDIPQMLEELYTRGEADSLAAAAVENYRYYETILLLRLAEEELQHSYKLFLQDFGIEKVVYGELCLDFGGYYRQEVYQLGNGEEVDEECYPYRVQSAARYLVATLINQGFTDTRGNHWSVEGEVGDTRDDIPLINLRITSTFTGETALHQLIERMKKHPEVPFYFSYEIDQHFHQSEQQLLEELRAVTKKDFLELKAKVTAEEVA